MADRYAINGGGTLNWNNTANWSTSSGGSGGASVPGASDTAILDGSSPSLTIDTGYDASVLNFNATAAYAGTLDLNGRQLQCADEWTSAGGSFTHNNGKIYFSGGASRTINNSANWVFYDVEVAISGFTIDLNGGAITSEGLFLLTSVGSISNGTVNLKGNVRLLDATISGTAYWILNGTANQTVDANGGSGMIGRLEVNNPGNTIYFKDKIIIGGVAFLHTAGTQDWTTYSATLEFGATNVKDWTPASNDYWNLTFNSNYAHTLLVRKAVVKGKCLVTSLGSIGGSYDIELWGDMQLVDTNFSASGTSAFAFVGTDAQKIYVDEAGGSGGVSRVSVNKPSGTLTVKDNITVSTGWSWSQGACDFTTSTIIIAIGIATTFVPGTNIVWNNVTFNCSVFAPTITGTWIVGGTLTITAVGAMAGAIECRGNVVATDTSGSGTATITFTGTANQTITAGDSVRFPGGNWVINKSAGKVTLASNLNLATTGQDLTVTDGELDLDGYTLTVADQFTVNDGLTLKGSETITATGKTISSTTSTVTYKDSAVTALLTTLATTYFNLTLGASKTHEIPTGAGNGITVNGAFASNGTSSTRSILRSQSDASSQWYLNLQGTSTLANKVNVKYSNANAGNQVDADGSVDSGNNNNWDFGAVALTATSISSATAVGTPTIAQKHALTASAITASTAVGTPTLGQVHALTASSITSATAVGTPTLGVISNLTANNIASATAVGTPTLGQVHALTASSITSSTSLGTPTLAEVHNLTATGITATTSVGTPTLGQTHALTAGSITSTTSVGTPALGQVHVLTATSITSATSVGTPTLAQIHVLTASSITSSTSVGTPTLGQVHALTASSITSSTTLGTPTLSEGAHNLTANSITSTTSVGTPTLTQVHALTASSITSSTSVGTPTLSQVHALTATSITLSTSVGTPTLGQVHALTASSITSSTSVGTPTLGIVHNLVASNIDSTITLGTPTLGVIHNLTANNINSSITFGTPTLGQKHALTANSISILTNLGTPTLSTGYSLVANSINAPTSVGTPTLGQYHNLTADGIDISTLVDVPSFFQKNILTASNISSITNVGSPSLAFADNLVADNINCVTEYIVQLPGPWLFNYKPSAPTIGQTIVRASFTRTGVR